MSASNGSEAERSAWMGLLARARPGSLKRAVARLGPTPEPDRLRPPQIGLVMTRGRAGATGSAFNLGEASVTRCALRLADGRQGIAYVLGRDKAHAERAALCDALLQGPEAALVRERVLAPLAAEEAERRAARSRKAAATRVEFFTLARGSD